MEECLLKDAEATGTLIVDVGGNLGYDLATLQQSFEQAPGRLVCQDLPKVIVEAQNHRIDPAIQFQEHDFFTPQPVTAARAYLLHYILHDWPDAESLQILGHLASAMRKGYSKLLVVEMVVATQNAQPTNTALDMTVWAVLGSKERTEKDWRGLFSKAGMKMIQIWSIPGSLDSVIEVELA